MKSNTYNDAERYISNKNYKSHDPYTDNDRTIPQEILDIDHEVVLDLCKRCNAGESQLSLMSCDQWIAYKFDSDRTKNDY